MRWSVVICALVGLAALQNATPPVRKQGKLEVPPYWAADFDDGRIGFAGEWYTAGSGESFVILDGSDEPPPSYLTSFRGSDFWFEPGTRQFLRPQHGAKFSKGIVRDSAYASCAAAPYTKNGIRIDNLPAGSQICIHTSDGRYASIQINGYDRSRYRLELAYTTWEETNLSGTAKPSH